MMPARRQLAVFCNAGAIWLVLRLPSPHSANPSFLAGCGGQCAGDARADEGRGREGGGLKRRTCDGLWPLIRCVLLRVGPGKCAASLPQSTMARGLAAAEVKSEKNAQTAP